MVFGWESHQPASLPVAGNERSVDGFKAEDDVSLLTLNFQVRPYCTDDIPSLGACDGPKPGILPCWSSIFPFIDSAAQFSVKPVDQFSACIGDLQRWSYVDVLSHPQANTSLAVDDSSEIGDVDRLHTLIIAPRDNKGKIKGVEKKGKKK